MNFRRLKIENIGSYLSTVINFDDLAFTLVKGENGAGKSFLFDALCWCLYDQTVRGLIKYDAVRSLAGRGCTELLCGDEGREILVRRERDKRSGNLTLEVNGNQEAGLGIQNRIDEVFGVNFDVFRNSCLFGQNDLLAFAEGTDKERKDIIGSLLGFDELDKIVEKVRLGKRSTEASINVLDGKISVEQEQLEGIVEVDIKQIEKELTECNQALDDYKKLREECEKVERKKEKKASIEKQLTTLEGTINFLKDRIQLKETDVLKNKDIHTKIKEVEKELELLTDVETKIDNLPLKELRFEKEGLVKIISLGEKCPTCEQEIPKQKREDLSKRLGKVEKDLKKCEREHNEIYGELKKRDLLRTALSGYTERLKFFKKNQEELKEFKKTLEDKEGTEKKKLEKELEALEVPDLDYDLDTLNIEIQEFERKRSEKTEILISARQTIAQKKTLQESLKIHGRNRKNLADRLVCLSILEEAFGQKGIKNILLDQIIPVMEEKVNSYLKELMEGVDVEFKTSVEGKTTTREELTILIHDRRGESITKPFKAWSGGEKMLLALALRLMLWNIGYMRSKTRMNFLLLDEVLSCLDAENREKVLELLMKLHQELGVKIIVISHLEELEDRFPNILEVKKERGISRVEVVR